ncbi:hypothetical protein QWE_24088 [Agrobacterium albertimagni AOL15]|uniref:Transmembrane protein n=1 Tax=Agrobacterium albertimagni AOL15 TaxID=1156935 RepID=K2PW54_9HYPH|nr:hypothetical protein [Agrobacterium albertimagni]EKF56930.1 hypothetical protein QWE_24088 [Agrobacterium albertimagni AOL15]
MHGFSLELTREFGAIELASALLYAFSAMLWLWTRTGQMWRYAWQVPTILLLMMGREIDLDKQITSVGILKSELYLTATAPPFERIFGLLVLAFLIVTIVRLAIVNGPELLAGLKARALWASSLAIAACLGVLSKSIDGLSRKLDAFGISIDSQTSTAAAVTEEIMELGIPIMALISIISSIRSGGSASIVGAGSVGASQQRRA